MQETITQRSMPQDSDRITMDEILKREKAGEEFTYVDVRGEEAWEKSDEKIPGAVRIPLDHADKRFADIKKDKDVITYCT